MMQIVSLSDAITLQRGFDLPTSRRRQGKYPVVASTGTTTTHDKFKVKGPGVVIGRSGSIGGGQYVESDFWPLNTTLWVKDFKGNDEKFIYYTLKSLDFSSFNVGAAVPTLNRNHLSALKVRIPDVDKQKKIANILGSLDEKIELNRRMNETLEQLGQTLFRHYFIDNPDAKNWKKRSLGEFFPVKTGKKDANFGTKDGKFPFFTCAQTISRAPSYSFDGSAILVAGNGDFNIKYYTGKFEAYQRTYVLIPHNEELLGFLYFLMKKDLSLITGGSRGSVIKFITKGMIENYRVELPDDNDLAAFAPIFSELLALISHINEQIQTLAALRDILLPKLISGEIEA